VSKRVTFSVTASSRATPQVLYDLLRDGSSWPTWSPIGSFELAQPSADGGEGVGAVRIFKTGTVRSREELIALTPDKGLSYSAVAGLPMRDHGADVELDEHDGVTAIVWTEEFRPKFPGTGGFLCWFLRHFVQRCADGLAAYAEGLDAAAGQLAASPTRNSGGYRS
jgi:Polyketide cyclase / dehydrase and lipid transport